MCSSCQAILYWDPLKTDMPVKKMPVFCLQHESARWCSSTGKHEKGLEECCHNGELALMPMSSTFAF